jgi:hypothetical protein
MKHSQTAFKTRKFLTDVNKKKTLKQGNFLLMLIKKNFKTRKFLTDVNKKKHKKNAEITIIYLFFKVKHEK